MGALGLAAQCLDFLIIRGESFHLLFFLFDGLKGKPWITLCFEFGMSQRRNGTVWLQVRTAQEKTHQHVTSSFLTNSDGLQPNSDGLHLVAS